MAHTPALINIETVVTDFIGGYPNASTNDYFTFLHHACRCYSDFRQYDSNQVVTAKVTTSANKIIEMPTDMIGFVDLCIPINGAWWSFTERREIVNTTTLTGLVESRDALLGEGVTMDVARTTGYSARGGVNDYNYTLDWEERRIFVEGVDSTTTVLFYTSSGIETSGTTQIPVILCSMIDSYLLWKWSYWNDGLRRERQLLEKDYKEARLTVRNFINSMSYNAWRDIILGSSAQAPQR